MSDFLCQTSYLLGYFSDFVEYLLEDKFDKILAFKHPTRCQRCQCPCQRSRSSPPNLTPALTATGYEVYIVFFLFQNEQTNKQTKQVRNTTSSSIEFKEVYIGYKRSYKIIQACLFKNFRRLESLK